MTDTGNGTTTQPSSTSTTIRLVVRASDTAPIFPSALDERHGRRRADAELAGHRHQARRRPAHLHRHEPAQRRQPRPGDGLAHLDAAAGPGRQLLRAGDRQRRQHEQHRDGEHHRHPHQFRAGVRAALAAVCPRRDAGAVHGRGRRPGRRLRSCTTWSIRPPVRTFNASNGLFTWTPGYGQAGDHTLHFTAADPVGRDRDA